MRKQFNLIFNYCSLYFNSTSKLISVIWLSPPQHIFWFIPLIKCLQHLKTWLLLLITWEIVFLEALPVLGNGLILGRIFNCIPHSPMSNITEAKRLRHSPSGETKPVQWTKMKTKNSLDCLKNRNLKRRKSAKLLGYQQTKARSTNPREDNYLLSQYGFIVAT